MFQSWLLNALNLLLPTVAVLLLFLSQQRLLRVTESLGPGELKRVFQRHHKRISIAMGLLAAWLVVQYLPLVYP